MDRQHAIERRSVPDVFAAPRPSRDVWKKFKSRGDNGDANDTKATIAAIVGLRAERARLLGFQSHAHWRMADTMAADPKAAQAFLLKVWPAVVARVRAEVAEMQAIADREEPGITIEPWDYLYFAERSARRNTISTKAKIKPYFELEQHGRGGAVVGGAAVRYRVQGNHRNCSGVSSGHARLGSHRRRLRNTSSPPLSRQLCAHRQAFWCVGDELPIAARDGRAGHIDHVEQQQFRQRRAR